MMAPPTTPQTNSKPPSNDSSRRESNKHAKRQRLLNESLRLFRAKGFEQTTVAEITAAAGVAKGTFFNYFSTKEDVLLALGEQTLGKLQRVEAAQVVRSETTRDKVTALFQALAAGLDADRDLVRQMVYRGLRLPDLVNRERARLDFRSTLSLLLAQGQRRGEIDLQIDIDFVAGALYMLYFQQVVIWCTSEFTDSLPERLDQVVDLVFRGIDKPHEQP